MKRNSERGSALIIVTVMSLILMGISGAYMTISYVNTRKTEEAVHSAQALYIAEAAASMMVHSLNHPKAGGPTVPTAINAPQKFGLNGSFTIPNQIWDPKNKTWKSVDNLIVDIGANKLDDDGDKVVDNVEEKDFYSFQAWGIYAGVTRKVEVLLTHKAGGVYWNAIFAGNKKGLASGDKYTLGLSSGDVVKGDIYSGGSIDAGSGASILGDNGSGYGTVTFNQDNNSSLSGPAYQQGSQEALALPVDAAGVSDWEKKAASLRSGDRRDTDRVAYIDVAYDLANKGLMGNFGGSNAVQIVDPNEPAHMFRKDPTDNGGRRNRTDSYEYTPKASGRSDYYFEDPRGGTQTGLTPVNGDTTAQGVNISPNGNDAVYFIDGNMRVSGESYKSYKFVKPDVNPMKMTMVVKGNVSFTDNMLLPGAFQSKNDALAIIALVDPDFPNTTAEDFQKAGSTPLTSASGLTIDQFVANYNKKAADVRASGKVYPDIDLSKGEYERASQEYNKAYGSGNVFFGDPGSGTVEHFEAFMYAENNFYATNLDTTKASGGTQKVEIFGNMTAGNQVKIVRNTASGTYVPLSVTLDTKVKEGRLSPPSLPSTPGFSSVPWFIASWKQVP